MGCGFGVLDRRSVGCGSRFWVDWAGVLGRWLAEFWADDVCGCSWFCFILCFVEDFEVFFFFLSLLLRFLDLEFVGGFGDCGCSLWRLICYWWWLSNGFVVGIWLCLF